MDLQLRPILSALRHSKAGALLVGLQMAVTMAVLCNAIFVIQQRLALSARPTGADETQLFVIKNQWIANSEDTGARVQADVTALRSIPGIENAYASNTYPLSGAGGAVGFSLHPESRQSFVPASLYLGDEQTLDTLGLKLVAGHNLQGVSDLRDLTDRPPISGILITKALARQLAPDGAVLGREVTMALTNQTMPIVGIVDRLQGPFVTTSGSFGTFENNSVIAPWRPAGPYCVYIVRAAERQLAGLMKIAESRLYAVSRERLISQVESLPEARRDDYREYRGLATMLGAVCALLLAVAAFGIVGLTSYWVSRRRRQIGVRRTLGATRLEIVQHFQTENFLMSLAGAVAGVGLAIGGNLWMVESLSMTRLPLHYVWLGAAAIVLLGQVAVLWPALRAASIPPAMATRSV
jgi:putative ABC transport system permease protein